MKNLKLRKLLKINSAKLRKANWNLTIPLAEARKSNELVALAESTLLRFVDNINGVDTESLYERQRELKREMKIIQSLDSSSENKARAREIRNEINSLLYVPELLLVVIDTDKDYWRAINGFIVNGITYRRLVATSAGVKLRTIVFADDRIRSELARLLDNDRNMDMPLVPAKLESYKGLAMSSSTAVSNPAGVIVVKDCVTHFKSDYIQLSDGEDGGEPLLEIVRDGDVELDNSDGYGLISPGLAEIWSAELGIDETASGFCVRNAFCKGMLFVFDFVKFASDVAGEYYITDVWGVRRNILDADIILTESQLKLWDSYDSIEHYLDCCNKNGYTFSVTKTADANLKETRELNYQFIQSFRLSDDEISELIQPTIDDISGVMGGDNAKAILYLKGVEMSERAVRRMEDDCVKALMIDPYVINDPYIRAYINRLISTRVDKAKLGRVRVNGDFMVASGDPYALCQSMFGLEITGLLKAGEIYAQYWSDRGVCEVSCFRAPMTIHNNIRKMRVACSEEMMHWYTYMNGVTITNCWDMLANSLNGMDYDGDTVLTTNNAVLVRNTKYEMPINCQQRKASKIVASENDMVSANLIAFGDSSSSIGSITNRATEMWDRIEDFETGSDEYNALQYRLTCSQQYQQNSIDRAKGIISDPMPQYWHNRQSAIDRDGMVGGDINLNIVADKKPYFMRYRYDETNRSYLKYKKRCDFDCMWKFGCSPEELMHKHELTDDEATYLMWYHKNSPVSMGSGVMNRLCRAVECAMREVNNAWSDNVREFNYSMYRTDGVEYSGEEFNTIRKILDEYSAELKTIPSFARVNNMDDSSVSEYKKILLEYVKQECYCNCSNGVALCNIILDYMYARHKGGQLVWDICGDIIVKNLLARFGGWIRYYEPCAYGNIDYKGQMFVEKTINMYEDDIDEFDYE